MALSDRRDRWPTWFAARVAVVGREIVAKGSRSPRVRPDRVRPGSVRTGDQLDAAVRALGFEFEGGVAQHRHPGIWTPSRESMRPERATAQHDVRPVSRLRRLLEVVGLAECASTSWESRRNLGETGFHPHEGDVTSPSYLSNCGGVGTLSTSKELRSNNAANR